MDGEGYFIVEAQDLHSAFCVLSFVARLWFWLSGSRLTVPIEPYPRPLHSIVKVLFNLYTHNKLLIWCSPYCINNYVWILCPKLLSGVYYAGVKDVFRVYFLGIPIMPVNFISSLVSTIVLFHFILTINYLLLLGFFLTT